MESILKQIKQFGFFPKVVDAPKDAVSFDKMIVCYLDKEFKRLYQVYLYNSKSDCVRKI